MSRARNLSKFKPSTTGSIADNTITNAMINSSAAIAKTKLASLDIVNADINASAAITRTKFASQVCVYANSTVNNGGFAAGAWEGVEFSAEVIDTNNAFNRQEGTDANNAGVFTCPVAGRYLISAGSSMATSVAYKIGNAALRLVKNTTGNAGNGGTRIDGTTQNFVFNNNTCTSCAATTTAIIDLSVGNKIWLQAQGNWWDGQWQAQAGHFLVMQVA